MSAMFHQGEEQKKAILASKARMEQKLGKPVKTAVLPLTTFWLAEDYHQKYELRCTADLIKEFKAIFPNEKDFTNSTAAARVNAYIGGSGTAEQLRKEIDLLGLSPEGKKRLQAYVTK
jgi:peptide-methionine (S)-S-oxide reductase